MFCFADENICRDLRLLLDLLAATTGLAPPLRFLHCCHLSFLHPPQQDHYQGDGIAGQAVQKCLQADHQFIGEDP